MRPISAWADDELRAWVGDGLLQSARRLLRTKTPNLRRNDPDAVDADVVDNYGSWRVMLHPVESPMRTRVSCSCSPFQDEGMCVHVPAVVLYVQQSEGEEAAGDVAPVKPASSTSGTTSTRANEGAKLAEAPLKEEFPSGRQGQSGLAVGASPNPHPINQPTARPEPPRTPPKSNDALQAALARFGQARQQVEEQANQRVLGLKLEFQTRFVTLRPFRLRPGNHTMEKLAPQALCERTPPYAEGDRGLLIQLQPYIAGDGFKIARELFPHLVPLLRKTHVFIDDPRNKLTWRPTNGTLEFTTADAVEGFTVSGRLLDDKEEIVALHAAQARLFQSGEHAWVFDGKTTLYPVNAGSMGGFAETALLGSMPVFERDYLKWAEEIEPELRSWGKVIIADKRSPVFERIEPKPFIIIEELPTGLRLTAALRYASDTPLVRIMENRDIRKGRQWFLRDAATEKRIIREFDSFVSGDPRVGEDQWFMNHQRSAWLLDEVLPSLPDHWEVVGREGLVDTRVLKGEPEARIRVESDFDWFDAKFEFVWNEEVFDGWELLRKFEKGERYISTPEGYVRLPLQTLRALRDKLAALPEGGRLHRTQAGVLAGILDDMPDAVVDAGWKEMAATLDALHDPEEIVPPPELRATLRAYQQRGLNWLAFLARNRFGGILADDMGLGKTLQTIAFLLWWKQNFNPEEHRSLLQPKVLVKEAHAEAPEAALHSGMHAGLNPSTGKSAEAAGFRGILIVAPSSVVYNWERELGKFAPHLRVLKWIGDQRVLQIDELEEADVVLTSYGILRRDVPFLSERPWASMVLDEAQAIKNAHSQTAVAARAIPAAFHLALSGTPIENHLGELWSYFEFCMPGFFGSEKQFQIQYVRRFEDENSGAREGLRDRIAPFVLRRLKQEVATELPPKTEMVISCELEPGQKNLYEAIRNAYKVSVFDKLEKEGLAKSRMHVLEALLKLRQACCDPRLVNWEGADNVSHSAKVTALFELVDEAVQEDHKIIIFSQFTKMLDILEHEIKGRGIDYVRLDGSTADRETPVQRFQEDPNCKVFLISLRAGGTGLNLTAADYVVHFDPWWNPAVEDQATDRAYRIGQTRPVFVYKLIAQGTVEELMLELQERKRGLVDGLLSGDEMAANLTVEDIRSIFAG